MAASLARLDWRVSRLEHAQREDPTEPTRALSAGHAEAAAASAAPGAPSGVESHDNTGSGAATTADLLQSKFEAFQAEVRDDRWADDIEHQSLTVIAGWPGVRAQRLECKSSICVLDLEFDDDAAAGRVDFTQLSATIPARVTTNEERHSDGRIARWHIVSKVSHRDSVR